MPLLTRPAKNQLMLKNKRLFWELYLASTEKLKNLDQLLYACSVLICQLHNKGGTKYKFVDMSKYFWQQYVVNTQTPNIDNFF